MRKLLVIVALLIGIHSLWAQELNTTVKINIQKLQTVDPKVFQTLEQSIREFMNSQKWTDDYYETSERITCNILLTIQEETSPTSFKAELAIQASRPIYNSAEETVLFNHIDRDVTFIYEQFQPLIFSRNSYNDNLSHILSFYAYIILGMDYDSFALLGGEKYFQAAQEILNSIPENAASVNKGWRSLDGNRNRYWIIENILSPRVRPFREAMYEYHRLALDVMSENVSNGRTAIVGAIEKIGNVNQAYPNSMIVQMFNNTKSQEIVEIFKRGTLAEQDKVIQIMSRVDPANSSKYRQIK
ncbi:MAG: DUF4835 family protein [Saprospiraceae bacterium]|nr:DUF4835 family protein [Saprospiraceae bacterium]